MASIKKIHAREILDSRGNPTVEVEVSLEDGTVVIAGVPSGASTGEREAVELRDEDQHRYGGRGVLKAVSHVNDILSQKLIGKDAGNQEEIDQIMIDLDGTSNKANLGANAILGVSMGVARAEALSRKQELFQYLGGDEAVLLPTPCFNSINGGAHADNKLDFQEFKFNPVGAESFSHALRMGSETYQVLKSLLKERGYTTGVGDEGGFAPDLPSNEAAVEIMVESIEKAGYIPGKDIAIGLDPAVSELWRDGEYEFWKSTKEKKSSLQMIEMWERWIRDYPIVSIEDALGEKDWEGWKEITKRLGNSIQLVGDDLFCTNPEIITQGINDGVANAVLIKVNQIGTLTETFRAIEIAKKSGYSVYISHRSGETVDDFIADLAVATGAGQIKSGATCRGERLSKYNRLFRIEELLGNRAIYAGRKNFDR
ncbi:MAG: phosphopyruvate hydratase [Candidatus Moraniibacteriota bacterium]|nr:MAG: phosphopyruvate hydratase [Candidatus Moranbacteria bacterium]